MPDRPIDRLRAHIAAMPPRQRHVTAMVFRQSEQPVLHLLADALDYADHTEAAALAALEADYHRQDAEQLCAPGADILDQLAAGTLELTEDILLDLETIHLASEHAATRQEAAQQRAAEHGAAAVGLENPAA